MEDVMEKYLFIAFRSREHTIKFYEIMKSRRIQAAVINTPKEAEAGCGLSVRFSERQKNSVTALTERYSFSSFIGIFEAVSDGERKYVRPV
mgnify:FL=1